MTKTPWEHRVGMLLDPERSDDFVWSYKPTDSGMYGGQPRLDWLACDWSGTFWMVEVKSLPRNRKTLSLQNDVTPGQRDALDAVDSSTYGQAYLAVGQENVLSIFRWEDLRCVQSELQNQRVDPEQAFLTLIWTGPKHWPSSLYALVLNVEESRATAPTRLKRGKPSRLPESSVSIWRPEGSTLTRAKTPLSER